MRELNGKMYFSCCKQVVRILVFQNTVEGKAAVLTMAKHRAFHVMLDTLWLVPRLSNAVREFGAHSYRFARVSFL